MILDEKHGTTRRLAGVRRQTRTSVALTGSTKRGAATSRLALGLGVLAGLLAGCGVSEEECDACRSVLIQIVQEADKEGKSSIPVCGDKDTGSGVAAGFEHACAVFRERCDLDLASCHGDTAAIADRLVSGGTASP